MNPRRTGIPGPADPSSFHRPSLRPSLGVVLIPFLWLAVGGTPAASQERPRDSFEGVEWSGPTSPGGLAVSGDAMPGASNPPGSAERPGWQYALASAAVPGIGQLARGQERGFAYLLVEALIWTGYVRERSLGLDARAAYRDLAWRVARNGAGDPGDGDFEYYERMSRWPGSGAFDVAPELGGIQPETDPATFNGDAWRLARQLFLGSGPTDPSNPGWTRAVDFYRERAYGEPLTWNWAGAEDQYRRFGILIAESDTRLGRASLLVGGAVLNRLVSSLDAFLSRTAGREATLRFRTSPVAASFGSVVDPVLELRIATP